MKHLNRIGDAMLARLVPTTEAAAAPCPCSSRCCFKYDSRLWCWTDGTGCAIVSCSTSC
ncbi:hypothetical protein LX16_4773 [Stackebrandtia albiflava]|uniref:Uncharacterized protein n=1 Tax=Stackebrandtia albiflava TaxID=406432 RepID=A0A562UQU8_9ACTN|nr:hypothetical protein [Stackebrandtia albiflava]TWJ07990.1 hypothetical protein LX16_4773 [Stackebrandtia albiflava]